FARYLALGSIGALIEDLDRRGIRTKANGRTDGRLRGGIRFGVGSLAHLLKNRFYVGEVVYRGEVHRGEHEPILDRALFAPEEPSTNDSAPRQLPTTPIMLAWTAPSLAAVKGIVHAPSAKPAMKPESREALLTAIVKARAWIDDIRLGRIACFAEIAKREAQG